MTSNPTLRPDGTTFPPVTPDPPLPPGYVEPDILDPGVGEEPDEQAGPEPADQRP